MPGIEEATSAFEALIDPAPNAPAPKKAEKADKPTERMFNTEEIDDSEDAGGDDLPDPEEVDESDELGTGEEGEGSDDDEGPEGEDDEDDDEEEVDPELKKPVTVKVDGKDVTVPLKEALEGYIRTATFHDRLTQLREAATTVEQEAVKVAQNRDKYSGLLDTLTSQLDELVPKEPDWDRLAEQDPKAAYETRVAWDKFKEQRKALEDEKVRVAKEKEVQSSEELKRYVVKERNAMLNTVPEWNDHKVRERDQKAMSATAKELGFSDDEISTVYDHRMMRVLLKAARYDRLMARKPQATTGHSKLTKHGAGDSSRGTAPKADVGAQKRLANTGSIEAAADVFSSMLNSERRASRKR